MNHLPGATFPELLLIPSTCFPHNPVLTSPKHLHNKPCTIPIVVMPNTVPRRYYRLATALSQCLFTEAFVLATAGEDMLTGLSSCHSWICPLNTDFSDPSHNKWGYEQILQDCLLPHPRALASPMPSDQSAPGAPASSRAGRGTLRHAVLSSHIQWQSKRHRQDHPQLSLKSWVSSRAVLL